jgi:hypothetical protein
MFISETIQSGSNLAAYGSPESTTFESISPEPCQRRDLLLKRKCVYRFVTAQDINLTNLFASNDSPVGSSTESKALQKHGANRTGVQRQRRNERVQKQQSKQQ